MTIPLRILVVEDSADDAEVNVLALSRTGLAPDWKRVETADEMRAALAEGPWDVVLSDYSLPGFSATEALDLCRKTDPNLPFVVVSGIIGEERAVELMRAGASDFLMKGSLGRLAPAVEREVREATGRRHRAQTIRLLEALVESSNDAIISKTLDGVLTSWNPAAERLYGWTAAEAVGRPDSILIPPDKAAEMTEVMDQLRAGDRVQPFETVRLHRDGTVIDVSLTVSPIKDLDGRLVGASASARDIRERKRAEDHLNRTTALLRAVADGTPDAVFVKDRAGLYLLANPAAAAFIGRPVEDIVGRDDAEFFESEDARRIMQDDRQVMESGQGLTRVNRLTAGGGTRTYMTTKALYLDANRCVAGVIGVSRDISEREQAAEALRVSEERLRVALTAAGAVAFVWDAVADRVVRYHSVEPALPVNVGEPEAFSDVLARVHPGDRGRFQAGVEACLATGTEYRNLYRICRPDGAARWLEEWGTLSRDAAGRPVRLVGISIDVTDRLKSEAALRESEAFNRSLMDASPDCIKVLDPVGRLLHMNGPGLCAMEIDDFGPLCREPWTGLWPADAGAEIERAIQTANGGTAYIFQAFCPTAKGRPRWWDVTVSPVRDTPDGRVVRLLAVSRDISERVHSEERLRTSEERFRAFMDHSPAAAWITDRNGRMEYLSASYRRTFRLPPGEIVGRAVEDQYPPEVAAVYLHNIRVVADTGTVLTDAEPGVRADGSVGEFLVYKFPLPGPGGGRLVGGVAIDVTDQKRAEAERAELLYRLNLQVERMPLAYLLSGPDMRYTRWNPTAERIFGFTQAEVLGKHPFEVIVPPESQAQVAGIFARLAAGDLDAHGVCENLTRDGRTITCEWYNTPLFNTDGTFQGLLSLAQDVTARRLRESELHLRDRAIQSVAGGIVISDATRLDYPIIYTSPSFERMTGYTGGEIVGRNCRFLQGPGTDPEMVKRLREAVRDGLPCDVELLNYRKDGTPFWNALSISPVHDSARRVTHFVGVQQDATERKRAEATLRDREELLRNVIAHIPAGVFWKDREGRFLGANDRFAQDQGFSAPVEVVGKSDFDLPVSRAEAEAFRAADLRIMVRGEPVLNVAETQTRSDGRMIHLLVSKVPLRDATGQVSGVLGVYQDVTEYRRLEDQFRQAQKMEAFGQLAGGVAHDFNNLLTIINGYSEMLLQSFPNRDPSREMIAEIHKAGERAAGLTRQLLAFSRQQILATRILNLNDVVWDTDKMLRRLIGEDIRMTTTMETHPWAVLADSGQVEQVLLNLAVNARDAMPKGGRLTIETKNVEVDESYVRIHKDARSGRYVVLSVADTGSGIPPAMLAKIFEPFFTTKEPGKGTGLGLATVYGIVKQSGGHVAVYSELGVGTTFKVYLPQAEQASERSKPPSRILAPPRGTETILLAEDEAAVRMLTRTILAGCGYRVLEATDGDEAVRLAAAHDGPIHLLLTDVVMPGAGGRAAAEQLTEQYPRMRVIYVSGYTDDAVIRHGVLREGVNFIQKPFTPLLLARKVRDVLDGNEQSGEIH